MHPIVLVLALLVYGAAVFITVGPHRVLDVSPLVWWASLSSACLCLFLKTLFTSGAAKEDRTCALLVCFCYLHRAVFMHCTVERDCFWDTPLCCSLWGRTVACTGELTFVYMSTKHLAPSKTKLVVALISIAQTLSFIGVMKRHYFWFFFENSIWTLCALGLAVHVFLYQKRECFKSVPYLLLAFVFYNVVEDLPMYISRHNEKTHLDGYNLGIVEGAVDALACKVISQDAKYWDPQMLWQTLNYTLVPAACIGLMACSNGDSSKIHLKIN